MIRNSRTGDVETHDFSKWSVFFAVAKKNRVALGVCREINQNLNTLCHRHRDAGYLNRPAMSPPSVAICKNGSPELRARLKVVALEAFRIRKRYLRRSTCKAGHGTPFTRMTSPSAPACPCGLYRNEPSS